MADLIVVPSEVDGWDVVSSDDSQALTNLPTKEEALKAARELAEHDDHHPDVVVDEEHSHGLDDTRRGVKVYVFALLGLLALAVLIIVVISLLASATGT